MRLFVEITCYCNNKVSFNEEWILQDIKGFTERKMAVAKCPICSKYHAFLSEKRTYDNKIFSQKIENKFVKKVLKREALRILQRNYFVNSLSLNGWIYGINKEIKNKRGEITQTRQYSSDFKGNKKIVRKYYERNKQLTKTQS